MAAQVYSRGTRMAIALKVSLTRYAFVAHHDDQKLRLEHRSLGDIEGAGYSPLDYPPGRLATQFLHHPAGLEPEAVPFLQHIATTTTEHHHMSIEETLAKTLANTEEILAALKAASEAATEAAARDATEVTTWDAARDATEVTNYSVDKAGKPAAKVTKPAPKPAAKPAPKPAAKPAEEDFVEAHTLDDLRTLFGELSEAGQREAAVAVFTDRGIKGVSKTPEDKIEEIWEALSALSA